MSSSSRPSELTIGNSAAATNERTVVLLTLLIKARLRGYKEMRVKGGEERGRADRRTDGRRSREREEREKRREERELTSSMW